MSTVVWMVFLFGALLASIITWPIAKAAGRKEQRRIDKEVKEWQTT